MKTKRALLTLALLTALSPCSFAEQVIIDQTQSFSGTAGNTSFEEGLDPFVFQTFDDRLGELLGVSVQYVLRIDNGIVGADNMTNEAVEGTATLGGKVTLSSDTSFMMDDYQSAFSPLSLTTVDSLYMEADPTMSLGGNGSDVDSFEGLALQEDSDWRNISALVWSQFRTDGQDTIQVDYDTDSIVRVDAPGSQGFFQAVDTHIDFTLRYIYEARASVATNVGTPVGVAALGLLGFMVARRKKVM